MTNDDICSWVVDNVPAAEFESKRVLLIVPDATRTAPLPVLFPALHDHLREAADKIDVLVALGTHPPMEQDRICELLGIELGERETRYVDVGLYNHEWNRPNRLTTLGELTEAETSEISGGLLSERVPVQINSRVDEYDVLLVVGPVFPHEVVGFSGGNKYFFPGISGPELLNFFHWLGALITNAGIIGVKDTPVRRVVDKAAELISVKRRCLAFVVAADAQLYGMFFGSPEEAWTEAADLSARVHVRRVAKPFHQVLSCAPPMYDELWVAGKCMYKLEPVVADGGELIIYAPHMMGISITHGELIEKIGYHVRDYFTKQPERFREIPRGVLAHSTHVRGGGTYENGVEKPRVQAAELILRYYRVEGLDVERKADESPVTIADRGAEELLRKRITQAWPDDGILGEELGETPSQNGFRWILDPIDGTKAFVHGVGQFGTLIGLEQGHEVLLGVANFPALHEIVYAANGLGTWWQIGASEPKRASVSSVPALSDALFCFTEVNGFHKIGRSDAFEALRTNCRVARGWGDCYGHILVATGRADVMVDPELNPWDAAPLLPIVEEAGGCFADWTGRNTIHGGNGFSSNGALKDRVLELLRI
eukprot:g26520.t1